MYTGGWSARMAKNLVETWAKNKSLKAGDKDEGTHLSCLGGIWVKNKNSFKVEQGETGGCDL